MKFNSIKLLVLTTALSTLSLSANAAKIIDNNNTKAVGNVVWHKQASIDPQTLINQPIPKDSASVFFIRAHDRDVEQTSANIAINDRFQVSLQPGSYSQVYSCAGINRLSAEVTGLKTNDLLMQPQTHTLEAGKTYFFYIDVSDTNNTQTVIKQITQDSALDLLKDKAYQTHQISRVVPNCPIIVQVPVAPPKPVKPTAPPAPVLREKVSIELEVLFDNDKAIIKPEHYNEVKEVADFMTKYSNTTTVIEGHTDSNGSDSYNQQLSQRRADAVKDMLINQFGIDANRVTAVGYGEAQPRASNATAEGRQQNRRVIAVIDERR